MHRNLIGCLAQVDWPLVKQLLKSYNVVLISKTPGQVLLNEFAYVGGGCWAPRAVAMATDGNPARKSEWADLKPA